MHSNFQANCVREAYCLSSFCALLPSSILGESYFIVSRAPNTAPHSVVLTDGFAGTHLVTSVVSSGSVHYDGRVIAGKIKENAGREQLIVGLTRQQHP